MTGSVQPRLAQLRQRWDGAIDALLILSPENRRYLSGFTGTAGFLLVDREGQWLATDFRYWEQAAQQAPQWTLLRQRGAWTETLQEAVADRGWRNIAVESDVVTLEQQQKLEKVLPDIQWVSRKGMVESLRVVKDQAEQAAITGAAALADRGFQHILGWMKPGMTERDVALELEFFLRREGAQAVSFEFIVASGQRSALPHGVASDKVIEAGDLLTLDFGCILDGYCSDMTRTVVFGRPTAEQRKVYDTVLEAQERALAAIAPGKSGRAIDRIARDVIEQAGYGERFGHGLGHGVGLVVHENPRLSTLSEDILEPGHVVTVEPGIYIPGWGGVRIEDLVIVTADGNRNLTSSPKKELLIL
ncbi:M24 family metallopeptidase [Heliobacterium gestii]|uniref:M24 family metallopeptidase n=1 Tax=Heliomicrobium gestii TaxID=2699 RepID=A0A845LAP5_HELGE|nr:aminopeptidase P family protein [Heliomicrobium gestii]MBM7867910.1 Xaa-Pro aminopeptidase [Heliomicrobium gestii]MZP43278.1 M24 family metallopeptidase [Heliomicrobium gestii]